LENLEHFEDKGVDYIIKDPEKYRGKKVVIAGGGDSALDWSIHLADIASELTLVHRRTSFRGALDSVEKVLKLQETGKLKLITEAEISSLRGNGSLHSLTIEQRDGDKIEVLTDHFIPLFGLSPKLGPMRDWGLNINRESIEVNTIDYQTNIPGIYAIGDINHYPGKLRLILCGFHEATLMVQSAYKRIHPDKNLVLKYTTVTGVQELPES
jgi:thioredoxin reductase (NADPH)